MSSQPTGESHRCPKCGAVTTPVFLLRDPPIPATSCRQCGVLKRDKLEDGKIEAPRTVHAPWTDEQVKNLNAYQQSGQFHPFACSCGCRGALVARQNGWHCPNGNEHFQTWAWSFMARPFLSSAE